MAEEPLPTEVAEPTIAEAVAADAPAGTEADQGATGAPPPAVEAAQRDGGAAAEPAERDAEDGGRRSSHRKERSSRRDRDEPSRDEGRDSRSERREKKSSRRGEDEPSEKKSSRHRDRDVDGSKKEHKEKRDRKERSRSRERKSDRKVDDRERRRSRHRSSSRERRKRRSRSPSRSRHRSSHRSRSRRRSPSRDRHKRRRSPSEDSDELGGYIPRRPDPSVNPEKRRDAVWSLAGAGYGGSSYMDPYGTMRGRNTANMTPEEMKTQMQEQQLHARIAVLQQQAQSAVAAASKTQREVYIGNLVGGLVTEEALRQLFNNTMAAAFPDQMVSGLDAVVNVSMHSEGRYAFVELRTPEMASAALQLSGQVQLLGQPISVGRPSGYVDPSAAQQAAAVAAAALEQFKRGEITLDQAAAAGMPSPAPAASAAGGAGAMPTGQTPPSVAAASPLPAAPAAAVAVPAGPPSQYLAVSGMVTAEVLADDEEYAEVIEDLRDECAKHGAVTAVTVPRPADKAQAAALFGTANIGKGFVAFGDVEAATRARNAIHGRLFAGITVQVAFVSQQEFDAATAANAANA